jgi:hypothetical protein
MAVRQIDSAGAEADFFRGAGERRQKHRAGGDVFGFVGRVLASIGLGETEFVGKNECLARDVLYA